ncbi:MAG: ParB/RepB/Spo0J family partition protein [Candidatus Aminicenantes bacterium]|nr:ParB/RepB/Spo0J family partition protein [Candidatus Aminicenantes bacterium]
MGKLTAEEMLANMRQRKGKRGGPTLSDIEAVEIPLDKIRIEKQVRKNLDKEKIQELAQSMIGEGLIEPVIVEVSGEEYILTIGERRVRAAQLLGWKMIPAIIKAKSNKSRVVLQLIENIQREDLHPIEIALAIGEIKEETGMTQIELADKIGKNKSYISKIFSILDLTGKVKPEELYLVPLEVLYLLSMKIKEKYFRKVLEKAKAGATVKQVQEMIAGEETRERTGQKGRIKKEPPIKLKAVVGDKDLNIKIDIGKNMAARLEPHQKKDLVQRIEEITKQLPGLFSGSARIGVNVTMEVKKERKKEKDSK